MQTPCGERVGDRHFFRLDRREIRCRKQDDESEWSHENHPGGVQVTARLAVVRLCRSWSETLVRSKGAQYDTNVAPPAARLAPFAPLDWTNDAEAGQITQFLPKWLDPDHGSRVNDSSLGHDGRASLQARLGSWGAGPLERAASI